MVARFFDVVELNRVSRISFFIDVNQVFIKIYTYQAVKLISY